MGTAFFYYKYSNFTIKYLLRNKIFINFNTKKVRQTLESKKIIFLKYRSKITERYLGYLADDMESTKHT